MLSAKHCNVPSKKEGHCLLCADSLFSQTVNQPHCPTRSFSLFILFIKLNGKGRNMEKKKKKHTKPETLGKEENTRPQYLILLVKKE